MKFETILLKGLFVATLVLCLGVMGAMLIVPQTARTLAGDQVAAVATRLPA